MKLEVGRVGNYGDSKDVKLQNCEYGSWFPGAYYSYLKCHQLCSRVKFA
jgi:hypothetical protein